MIKYPKLAKWTEPAISVFKYLIAGYMMFAGVLTAVAEPLANAGPLGFLYSSRLSLVIIGCLAFVSGAVLLYGKVRKSKKWTGRGLFYIYLLFFFFGILNAIAFAGDYTYWVGNAVAALITGALWLRWKFKTEYVNPKHFVRDIDHLSDS